MQKYTEKFTALENASLSQLIFLMESAAERDITERGVGFEAVQSRGITWVLTQLHAEVTRYPQNGEALECATWPTEMHLGMYPRRYELRDAQDNIIISMHGIWMLMDMRTRTLADWNKYSVDVGDQSPEKLRPQRRIHVPAGGTVTRFSPTEADIDVNRHMNNVAYIDVAERAFSRRPAELHINFEHEILLGETAELRTVETPEGTYFSGATDKPCFRAFLR